MRKVVLELKQIWINLKYAEKHWNDLSLLSFFLLQLTQLNSVIGIQNRQAQKLQNCSRQINELNAQVVDLRRRLEESNNSKNSLEQIANAVSGRTTRSSTSNQRIIKPCTATIILKRIADQSTPGDGAPSIKKTKHWEYILIRTNKHSKRQTFCLTKLIISFNSINMNTQLIIFPLLIWLVESNLSKRLRKIHEIFQRSPSKTKLWINCLIRENRVKLSSLFVFK